MQKRSSKWIAIIDGIKSFLSNNLKRYVTKEILRRALGTAIGGIKGLILTHLISQAWYKWVQPVIDRFARNLRSRARAKDYQEIVKNAQEAETMEEFDDATRDLP